MAGPEVPHQLCCGVEPDGEWVSDDGLERSREWIPTHSRTVRYALPLLLVALLVTFWVCHVFATKIKMHPSGVVISVPEGLESTDPFSVSIVAGVGVDFPEAALVLMIRDCDENSRDTSTIWVGEIRAGSPIEISHSLSGLPVGRYRVAALLRFPPTAEPPGGASDGFYVEITDSGWVVSEEDFRTQELRGIMAKMREAGLDTCTGKQLGIVAPDIRRRLEELGIAWPVIDDIEEPVDGEERTPSGDGESVRGSLGPSRSRPLTPEHSVRLIERLRQLEAEERQRHLDSLAAGDTVIVDTTLPPKVRPPRVRPPRPDFNGPQGRRMTEEEAAKIREGLARTHERMRIQDSLKADSAKGGAPR